MPGDTYEQDQYDAQDEEGQMHTQVEEPYEEDQYDAQVEEPYEEGQMQTQVEEPYEEDQYEAEVEDPDAQYGEQEASGEYPEEEYEEEWWSKCKHPVERKRPMTGAFRGISPASALSASVFFCAQLDDCALCLCDFLSACAVLRVILCYWSLALR